MILLLDNYDSFTYNLAQYFGELGCDVEVHRNDKIAVEEIARRKPERIVISPGPCTPRDAGICIDLIRRLSGKFPILGVCLGHQAIGEAFGGKVIRAPKIFHGKTSQILLGGSNCSRIAIQSDDKTALVADSFSDQSGMAASAQCAIDDHMARLWPEPLDDVSGQNGYMNGRSRHSAIVA